MNQLLLVRVVQCSSNLLYNGDDLRQFYACPPGRSLAQGAVGGVAHNKVWVAIVDSVVKNTHDIGVFQTRNGTRLVEKGIFGQRHMHHLERALRLQVDVLPQVDIREAPLSQPGGEAIVPYLLPQAALSTLRHDRRLLPMHSYPLYHCYA